MVANPTPTQPGPGNISLRALHPNRLQNSNSYPSASPPKCWDYNVLSQNCYIVMEGNRSDGHGSALTSVLPSKGSRREAQAHTR